MKNTLSTLQDVLLIFTVVVLVYVLYKRLLIVLGKKKHSKVYPTIGEKIIWTDQTHASIEVNLKKPVNLELSIFDSSNALVQEVLNMHFEVGQHALEVNCSALTSGKYYFKIVAPESESSHYFVIA